MSPTTITSKANSREQVIYSEASERPSANQPSNSADFEKGHGKVPRQELQRIWKGQRSQEFQKLHGVDRGPEGSVGPCGPGDP